MITRSNKIAYINQKEEENTLPPDELSCSVSSLTCRLYLGEAPCSSREPPKERIPRLRK
ncbi:hypothetical protein COCSUDRAFT_34275 [Coccomyxa subellipsoidea C-169]|uniref:Uncharacterized protein n=1 Tax=Coccomyxa subellipsoidea (strain C-169) TaxID=574566 RepID=I0YLT6_COCSC|nr:hypothetical protein COCSUDRAFT_34275 [Coccomyxa subellipsoidea C-169]EIE19355.1 hypothetical protein COCSUDRAFT_34275 [Coccomyxa subellipsoidea C-169]|eukprot:XP_005643899.1 hypothetical protein COCSUDRAFT_34275 [Coccomyxa subellipsoidea C-169]